MFMCPALLSNKSFQIKHQSFLVPFKDKSYNWEQGLYLMCSCKTIFKTIFSPVVIA